MKLRQRLIIKILKHWQKNGAKEVEVFGKKFTVAESVFNPKFFITSKFFAENLIVKKDDEVLDIGTGS